MDKIVFLAQIDHNSLKKKKQIKSLTHLCMLKLDLSMQRCMFQHLQFVLLR